MRAYPVSLLTAGLAALTLGAPPAGATIITHGVVATVVAGPFAGAVGVGSFSYDDTDITGVGGETIMAAQSLTLTFTLFGQTFVESNDSDYASFPELSFLDGVPVILDFVVDEASPFNPVPITEPGVFEIALQSDLTPLVAGGYSADVFINDIVPEPAGTVFAVVSGLGLAAFVVRRRLTQSRA